MPTRVTVSSPTRPGQSFTGILTDTAVPHLAIATPIPWEPDEGEELMLDSASGQARYRVVDYSSNVDIYPAEAMRGLPGKLLRLKKL